ncbi:4Fe-4S ferredoxin, iron-sulfur binding [Candidatus Moduliflexus flocculans]|uniref:4Fe-4S ferredoxin, iron-sulfur binding n=1 Tax=Candidatus Moduliflexus flocculans TaxID=1499966 RepID=A0A081BTF0_9BACT|nr:4Fe-4S ferredoxin, iron-sulfur binding [Candidatus Moduliflexus flocculans]
MSNTAGIKIAAVWVGLILFVVVFSSLSMQLWGGAAEKAPTAVQPLVIQDTMTLREEELQQPIQSFKLSPAEITEKVQKTVAFAAEEGSKNWIKIVTKLALWVVFLVAVFFQLKNRRITAPVRKAYLLAAVTLFGVILGSDPNTMGTVKDAIVLFAKSRIIFPPRMIVLTAMLVGGTLLANKLICSWGCQFGTLQDLIFRFGRDAKDRKGVLPQWKIPFVVTNTIRMVFFALFTVIAFAWAFDVVGVIDPFKIFNPAVLGTAGIVWIALMLIASLFVYRPWCHLFCPFGLIGWLVEKISVYKIKVKYETCVACNACAEACPSTVMGAILKRDKTIPDCFACGTCIEVCPTQSIEFASGKRDLPPAGKFDK